MEWWHSGLPHPKKVRVQKTAGKILASIFLGSTWLPPHWFPSKEPNYQSGVLLISACVVEGHFEGKTPREVHQGGLYLNIGHLDVLYFIMSLFHASTCF